MVMAAGLGTRLKPFTDLVAKPILPIMGVPMIQFVFDALKEGGVNRAVINIHSHAIASSEAVRFLDGPKEKIISDESSLLLGSAGGLVQALPHFNNEPFFMVNADTICRVNLRDLATVHMKLKHDLSVKMTLVVFARSPGAGKYRTIGVDPKRNVVRSIGDPTQNTPFFSGVAVIEPEALSGLEPGKPADFLEQVLRPAVLQGRVGAYVVDNTLEETPHTWFDIGSPELWHKTHLDFMRLYEEVELPSLWRQRIEKSARRLGAQAWVSNRTSLQQVPSRWNGPFFWDSFGAGESSAPPPKVLGPNAILYGSLPDGMDPESAVRGVGYGRIWKPIG